MSVEQNDRDVVLAEPARVGVTAAIIDEVTQYHVESLPNDVIEVAKHCLLDWIGVTLSGAREPVTQILLDQAIADGGHDQCAVLGRAERVTVAQACLIHGAASHSQDYDDVLEMMLGHPTAPVAPVVMALGERDRHTGGDLIAALVAGVQVEASIGVLVEPHHHEQGWHTTATLGTFGAAAAACHLLGADEAAWNRAFGLAATSAGGLKSMFGTMAKPFHAGKASALGYQAASLAIGGLTAGLEVLDIPRGFIDVTTPKVKWGEATPVAPSFAIRQVLFKDHAACYLTHSTIAGVIQLAREHGLTYHDIERIDLMVLPVHLTTCAVTSATTGLEAKFSLQYSAAIALIEGRAGEAQFDDATIANPRVRDLAARVVLHEGDWPHPQMATPVRISTMDGRRLDIVVDMGLPTQTEGLVGQWSRLTDKFMGLAAPVVQPSEAMRIVELVARLEQLSSLDELMPLLSP